MTSVSAATILGPSAQGGAAAARATVFTKHADRWATTEAFTLMMTELTSWAARKLDDAGYVVANGAGAHHNVWDEPEGMSVWHKVQFHHPECPVVCFMLFHVNVYETVPDQGRGWREWHVELLVQLSESSEASGILGGRTCPAWRFELLKYVGSDFELFASAIEKQVQGLKPNNFAPGWKHVMKQLEEATTQ